MMASSPPYALANAGLSLNPRRKPLQVYLLGLADFEAVQRLQQRLVYDLGETGGAALVLCEHPPTISVGRTGSRAHIAPDDDALRAKGIRVRWVNRGGGCILHAPGQLSAYLALRLDQFGLNVQEYVRRLNEVLIATLEEFDLRATTRSDVSGIFLDHARVGTVAIAVSRYIAYHGMTLNVGNPQDWREMLQEPGPNGLPLAQTTIEARRQRPAAMSKAREAIIRHAERVFGLERCDVYTWHPLIPKEVRHHVRFGLQAYR